MSARKRFVVWLLIVAILVPQGTPLVFAGELMMEQDLSQYSEISSLAGYFNFEQQESSRAYDPFGKLERFERPLIPGEDYLEDRILVKMASPNSMVSVRSHDAVELLQQGDLDLGLIDSLEPIFPEVSELQALSLDDHSAGQAQDLTRWYRASLKSDTTPEEAIRALEGNPYVEVCEYDYIYKPAGYSLPSAQTDPDFNLQWHLERSGIIQAWEYLASQGINPGGLRDVVVAVIDTGVDYTHPDLAGNMWVNTAEIPDGIDNDGNGFVDDIHGADFIGGRYHQNGDPMDYMGHGTHVAGIIAAMGGNGIGGVGVAPNVQIMALKAGHGYLASSDIAAAIYYAIDKGADVINMSFGGYGRSTVVEDALAVAFGSAVLVAAAGNDSTPTLPHPLGANMYPAAYPWVLGVMAEDRNPNEHGDYMSFFSNWDYIVGDSHEYDVMAPGSVIYSTLPGNQYDSWSGTSMAAPIVSGIAALLRSFFSDKDVYSSRFIMGQIASTGTMKQAFTVKSNKTNEPDVVYEYPSVNALAALTQTPMPSVSMVETWLFDSKDIDPANNGDGVVDAGETIDLALVLRNHWGKADDVVVTIDAISQSGQPNPYVTFIENTVNYGAIGNFGIDDNGFIYEDDVIVGVRNPFRLKIAENAPNDFMVNLNVTITARNGFDPGDQNIYTSGASIPLKIRSGSILPAVITEDMTLTKDRYWIVSNAVTIEKGATVRVEPGTQIQFWSSEPEDPYAEKAMAYIEVKGNFFVEGTPEEPVEMFPSALFQPFEVKIFSTEYLDTYGSRGRNVGNAILRYAKIMNPNIAVNSIDHCYFSQADHDLLYKRDLRDGQVFTTENYGPVVSADTISSSQFYNMGVEPWGLGDSPLPNNWMLRVYGDVAHSLFDSNMVYVNQQVIEDSVFLKNYKLSAQQYGSREYLVSRGEYFSYSYNREHLLNFTEPVRFNDTGSTYFALGLNLGRTEQEQYDLAQEFAESFGGYLAVVNDELENQFLAQYLRDNELYSAAIGLSNFADPSTFSWICGMDSEYVNWAYEQPMPGKVGPVVLTDWGEWRVENWASYYLVEVPGDVYVTGISLSETEIVLGAGGQSFKLVPRITPAHATNQEVVWTSENPEVASVDESGVVTPLAIGQTRIIATTVDGGYTATCDVTVIEVVAAAGVELSHDSVVISTDEPLQLIATVLPYNTTNRNVSWTSSDPSIAMVDQTGLVWGLAEGTATITVTTEDGGYTASCLVTVQVPVKGLSLDSGFVRLVLGDEGVQLTATVTPENATNKTVLWTTSNSKIVDVDNEGRLTPLSEGTAMITATTEDGGFEGTCVVTVWEHAVAFESTKVSGGEYHSLALNNDGTVWSWGRNNYGQLGDGTSIDRNTPVQVLDLSDVVDIAAGDTHSLALKADGTVWAWGYGYLGDVYGGGTYTTPVLVKDLMGIVAISAGDRYSLALKEDGTVWAWGRNNSGQLGDGTTSDRYTPIQVQGLDNVMKIVAGYEHALALKSDGTIWAWGSNSYGQLGDGTANNRSTPVQVQGLKNAVDISAGSYDGMALLQDGTVWGWGSNYDQTPTLVSGLTNVQAIASGNSFSLAQQSDGTIWSWGSGSYGQLGDAAFHRRSQPQSVPNLGDVVGLSAGKYHSLAIKSDGTVWAFGRNDYGQLGNMKNEHSAVPVQALFGILPDTTAPYVLSTVPVNYATNVPVDSSITITFSEGIRMGSDFGLIALRNQDRGIVSLKERRISNDQLILQPMNPLEYGQTYTVRIPAGAVSDVFNNELASEFVLTFTTEDRESEMTVAQALTVQDRMRVENTNRGPAVTQADLDKALQELIASGDLSTIRNNAILNRWWDPDVNHWLRFTAREGSSNVRYLSYNYWGTDSDLLIGKAIIDFNDFRTLEEIIYKPILTEAPETAYPFVVDVWVSTHMEERATSVGAEEITVNVLFNRDMNTEVQPQVSFGPDLPTTDYTVHPISGGWQSPRLWEGRFNITPITGDGYQMFRIAGAQAADDPWLVTGNDTERFRFEIITSGTEAMHLQASGGDNQITLTWTQDDFETLAGYHMYRSEELHGTYERINSSIIPSGVRQYTDKDVEPGRTYYYKFTVVKSDMSESDYSNVAAAAAYDSIPPVIYHDPVRSANPGANAHIVADVTDNIQVREVHLYYRAKGQSAYHSKQMVNTMDNRYSATLEGSIMQPPGVEYYIEASDGASKTRSGSASSPYFISIVDTPVINSVSPSSGTQYGGTEVTITGSNFKQGATVLFGGAVAEQVIFESPNRLTAVTPPHRPELVDVTVINPDTYKDTLYRAFNYISEEIEVSVPDVSGNTGQVITVPVEVGYVEGLMAVDLKVAFDPTVIQLQNVEAGHLTSSFIIDSKIEQDHANIALASSQSVTGYGPIVNLEFLVVGDSGSKSQITLAEASLNGGAMPTSLRHGSLTVADVWSISGSVVYYQGGRPIPRVDLNLHGDRAFTVQTNAAGSYVLSGIPKGDYTLTARKSGDVHGLSAYDAALILQAAVGKVSLSELQQIAADVDGNGVINALDATYVLENSVGLRELPFPGVGKVWHFEPESREFTGVNYNIYSQDFTGVLIGDVTGSWNAVEGSGFQNNLTSEVKLETSWSKTGEAQALSLVVDTSGTSLYGVDLAITYDPALLKVQRIQKAKLAENAYVIANATQPGTILIGLASSEAITGEGGLLDIHFEQVQSADTHATVELQSAYINEQRVKKTQSGKLITTSHDVTVFNDHELERAALFAQSGMTLVDGVLMHTDDEQIMVVVGVPQEVSEKAAVVSAMLFADLTGHSRESCEVELLVQGISDPDNLGLPVFPETDGHRLGLNYQYRDARVGMNVPWSLEGSGISSVLVPSSRPQALACVHWKAGSAPITVGFDVTGIVRSQGLAIQLVNGPIDDAEFHLDNFRLVVFYDAVDQAEVPPVKGLSITEQSGKAVVDWDHDAHGTRVMRSANVIPAGPFDHQGEVVSDGPGTSLVDDSLVLGNRYFYALYAYDSDRHYSEPVIQMYIPGTPNAPTLTAAQGNAEILLDWSPVTGADEYTVYRRTGGQPFERIHARGITETSYRDAAVEPGTIYEYTVVGKNMHGEGRPSNVEQVEAAGVPSVPKAPVGLAVKDVTQDKATLWWLDQGGNQLVFVLEQESAAGWSTAAEIKGNASEFTIGGLDPAQTYRFRLRAKNSAGLSGPSNVVAVTTLDLPVRPQNAAWHQVSPGSVELTWDQPGSNVSTVRVVLLDEAGQELQSYELAPSLTKFRFTGLEAGRYYNAQIIFTNANGSAAAELRYIITTSYYVR